MSPTWHATPTQIQGLKRLHQLAEVFVRAGRDQKAGFRPLTKSLIIGESGSGKSKLAREFAIQRDWPLLSIDCGSWIPQGSSTKPGSLRLIRDHLRSCDGEFSVLYLDEICKLLPVGMESSSSWTLGCWSEYLALADSDGRLRIHEWTDNDIRLLRYNCYVLAGGAFTEALKEARASGKRGDLGFASRGRESSSQVTYSSKIRERLPEEILSRFHPAHIILQPPERSDYAKAIEDIHQELRIPRTRSIEELLDEAQSCPGGMRWVEAYLTEILVVNLDRLPVQRDEWHPETHQGYDFFFGSTNHYAREATKASFQLRAVLARMHADLAIRRPALSRGSHRNFSRFLYGAGDDIQNKLSKALIVAKACGNVRADDHKTTFPILIWKEAAWKGIAEFPSELARYGLIDSFTKSWDCASRVCELRGKIAQGVAAGRYGGPLP